MTFVHALLGQFGFQFVRFKLEIKPQAISPLGGEQFNHPRMIFLQENAKSRSSALARDQGQSPLTLSLRTCLTVKTPESFDSKQGSLNILSC